MNSKKSNRINVILNIVLLVALLLMMIFGNVIDLSAKNNEIGFFKNGIVELLFNSWDTIKYIIFISLFIFSIISAIQNRKDKKIVFWKIVLGVSSIVTMIQMVLYNDSKYEIEEWLGRIFFGIIPIILAIVNLILIKKNKPKVIQGISYVVTALCSILILLDIWGFDLLEYIGIVWCLIAVIMQLIYIHVQENVDEGKIRKIINIVICYILQTIISIGLFVFIAYSLLVYKINFEKIKNEATNIVNKIYEQSAYNSNKEFFVVNKDSKYGLIDEKGQEVTKIEYDLISDLCTLNINNKDCECSFAKKDNDFHIVLNNNNIIDLQETNSDYFKNIYESMNNFTNPSETDANKYLVLMTAGLGYLSASEGVKITTNKNSLSDESILVADSEDFDDDYNYVYTYNLSNGIKMIITEIEIDEDEEEYEYNLVTKKNNQVIQNDKNVNIPIDYQGNIKLYSNGNIPFCNLEKNIQGWYDIKTGQAMSLQGSYQILDAMSNNYLLIRDYNTNQRNEMIVDGNTGNIILSDKHIDKLKSGYIITNENKKMYFVDETGTTKSQQFDYILDGSAKGNEILICVNKNSNKLDCKLMDSKGNILTKQTYPRIGNSTNWSTIERTITLGDFEEEKTKYDFDEIYDEYYRNARINNSKKFIYTVPNGFIEDTENEEEGFIEFESTKEDYEGKDVLWFSKTDEDYTDLEDYLLSEIEIKIGDAEVSEEEINGVKWNKVVYNSTTTDKKVSYIYVVKDGDFYYEFTYVDFGNNDNSTIEQVKNTLVLK